jgi:hypothetical protein
MPQPPDARQEDEVREARYAQTQSILDRLVGALDGNGRLPHHSPQDLGHLQIQPVRRMQRFAVRVNSRLNLLSHASLKKPIDRSGRIQYNHRASRSSCTRRAVLN